MATRADVQRKGRRDRRADRGARKGTGDPVIAKPPFDTPSRLYEALTGLCSHAVTRVRFRVNRAGVRMYTRQCLVCGQKVGRALTHVVALAEFGADNAAARRSVPTVEPFDVTLCERWRTHM